MARCQSCQRVATHQCGACRAASYCSAECQQQDWLQQHSDLCTGLQLEQQGVLGDDMLSVADAKRSLEKGYIHHRKAGAPGGKEKVPLTPASKRFLGWVAGGRKPYASGRK